MREKCLIESSDSNPDCLNGEHSETHWVDGNASRLSCRVPMVVSNHPKEILMSQVWRGGMFESGQDVMGPGAAGQGRRVIGSRRGCSNGNRVGSVSDGSWCRMGCGCAYGWN